MFPRTGAGVTDIDLTHDLSSLYQMLRTLPRPCCCRMAVQFALATVGQRRRCRGRQTVVSPAGAREACQATMP